MVDNLSLEVEDVTTDATLMMHRAVPRLVFRVDVTHEIIFLAAGPSEKEKLVVVAETRPLDYAARLVPGAELVAQAPVEDCLQTNRKLFVCEEPTEIRPWKPTVLLLNERDGLGELVGPRDFVPLLDAVTVVAVGNKETDGRRPNQRG